MAEVTCSEQAQGVLDCLQPAIRAQVSRRLEYLTDLPRMYPITTDVRFPGCRSFWVDPCYRVFYMVAAMSEDLYVLAVVQEDVDLALGEF